MAPPVSELDRDLRAMWKSASTAREGAGGIYRAALCNLVTPVDPESHRRFAPTLVEVTRRHPSRLLLVEIDHGETPRELSGEVAALCHLRPAGGYVCSEQIVLRGGAGAGPLVPSAVRSLLVGNLPLTLLDLRTGPTPAWVEEISERADLRLMDSANLPPGADRRTLWMRIAEDEEARLRDLSWSCLAPWREAVADAFDTSRLTPRLQDVGEITVEVGRDAPCGPGAPLLAGWIASRLRWSAPRGTGGETRFRKPDGGTGVIRVARSGAPGRELLRLELVARERGRLDVAMTHAPGASVATVEVRAPDPGRYEIPFAARDLVSLILTEMHRHRPNRVLGAAARVAAEISLPDEGVAR
ncbi:MAG TPA: glucose-6-phosphate dehydrogenase assembly protein OpcA [Candidatus Eisenbacteria bacterium]|nr:glucose-6-phosphate dehydrogenase assembly protein OpcA [Candidatus Eisenbacteria bacterium]